MIGGHSVGAIIALEMAQQLRARGREVSLLVVLDGELFNTGTELGRYNPLYWFKLLINVPNWIRDVLLVEFTARTFCKMVYNKPSWRAKSSQQTSRVKDLPQVTPLRGLSI